MATANVRAARASCELKDQERNPDQTPLLIKQNLAANSANLRGKPQRENRGGGLVRFRPFVFISHRSYDVMGGRGLSGATVWRVRDPSEQRCQ